MKTEAPAYKRVVLKLSGEALQERGSQTRENISPAVVREIAERIKGVNQLGVQVAIVIGGGNIWRGSSAAMRGMDRSEEHTPELQPRFGISHAVFCLKKK